MHSAKTLYKTKTIVFTQRVKLKLHTVKTLI